MCHIGYTFFGLQYEVSESGIRSMLSRRQDIPSNVLVGDTTRIRHYSYDGFLHKPRLANKICNTNTEIAAHPAYASEIQALGFLLGDHILHESPLQNGKLTLV